ncbi:hypothetical protein [Cloacibacillus evryensis]|jgi:hypothetical protein|uniref:Uncharacterized protein n=1 Tax=Cloacibacillus evryensis TaxID=508460 RepID=A0AAW5K7C4_9BACT|nr:hypothetical protein [Cloacibacillus evryensis]EHL68422.1 hypothetical protein HMPREF1006_02445 [Synergistes sp. 3_1_syn1]MCQ4814207.1 hypothetical protein [Cloacibacillus evryensis]
MTDKETILAIINRELYNARMRHCYATHFNGDLTEFWDGARYVLVTVRMEIEEMEKGK